MLGLGLGITNNIFLNSFLPQDINGLEIYISAAQQVQHTSNVVNQWNNLNDNRIFLKTQVGSEPVFTPSDPSVKFVGQAGGDALALNNRSSSEVEITLNQGDGGYTICFIATCEGLDSEGILFGSKSNANAAFQWLDDSTVRLRVAGSNYDFDTGASLNDEDFYSFMFVVTDQSGNNARMYINNTYASQKEIQENFVFGMLGGNNNVPNSPSFQKIKQMIIYNNAISDTDRGLLYTNVISPQI